ncbi:MAG: HEAT repeat domain-containing protein [Pirellulales bacterium]
MAQLGSTRLLGGAAVLLAVIVLLVYWRPWKTDFSPQDLLEVALSADDAQQRAAAASQLAARGNAARVELRQLLAQSQDAAVTAVAVQGLAEIWDHHSMPEMIDAMNHESGLVRGRAVNAVERILGAEVGLYSNTDDQRRRQLIVQLQRDWQVRSQSSGVIERLDMLAAQSGEAGN